MSKETEKQAGFWIAQAIIIGIALWLFAGTKDIIDNIDIVVMIRYTLGVMIISIAGINFYEEIKKLNKQRLDTLK